MSFKGFLVYSGLLLFAAGLVAFPTETADAAKTGIKLCAGSVVPALFPFFVLSGFIVESDMVEHPGVTLRRIMRRLFKLDGACAAPVVLGLIGGYPIGAYTTVRLYKNRLCTKEQANRLLGFCNNSGPAFILGAAGNAVFGDMTCGALLLAVHVLSALTLGWLLSVTAYSPDAPCFEIPVKKRSPGLAGAFTDSVISALKSCLNISAFIVFFSVVLRLMDISGIIPALSRLFGGVFSSFGPDYDTAYVLITGAVEVTNGLFALSARSMDIQKGFIISAFMLGFAGFSIHSQTVSVIAGSGLSVKRYIAGKLLHGIISAVYAGVITLIFPLKPITAVSFGPKSPVFPDILLILPFAAILPYTIAKFLKTYGKSG